MNYHSPHVTCTASPDEIERLLHHMGAVANQAKSKWAANFAASLLKQRNHRGWTPSSKQLGLMRRLVGELFTHGHDEGDDFQLIE